MLLVIDNYDSFTYNLVQYLGEMDVKMEIHRNDQISVEAALALKPERVLISPGPCSPNEAGLSNDLIRAFAERRTPIFGVCLGHQCIAHTFGAKVVVNGRMMHGKTSPIHHDGKDLFEGMPNPFNATRYHSLVAKKDTLPPELIVTAWTEEDEVMGLKHAVNLLSQDQAVPSREHPHGKRADHPEEFPEVGPQKSRCENPQ